MAVLLCSSPTPSAMAHASGPASLAGRLRARGRVGGCDHARKLATRHHGVERLPCRAQQRGGFVDRQQNRKKRLARTTSRRAPLSPKSRARLSTVDGTTHLQALTYHGDGSGAVTLGHSADPDRLHDSRTCRHATGQPGSVSRERTNRDLRPPIRMLRISRCGRRLRESQPSKGV